MKSFTKAEPGEHNHIHTQENGYIYTEITKSQMEALDTLAKSGKGGIVEVVGGRRCGKQAFVEEFERRFDGEVVRVIGHVGCEEAERAFRQACQLRLTEELKVVVGEVVEMSSERITLKTLDIESEFEIGARMRLEIERQKVQIGDVIKIYREAGLIVRLGVSSSVGQENKIYGQVPLPEGECLQIEKKETKFSLAELDIINSTKNSESCLCKKSMNIEVRGEVNKKITEWVAGGKAKLKRGVVVVYGLLNTDFRALVSVFLSTSDILRPLIIVLNNKPSTTLQKDSLKLVLKPRDDKTIAKVIEAKALSYGIKLPKEMVDFYANEAKESGLSHTLGIMHAAAGKNAQTLEHIEQVASLFGKKSTHTSK